MRILLVTANYRPSVGGIERFVELLGEGLAERGHQVTVAACRVGGAPLVEEAGCVRVVRIPASDAPRRLLNVPYPLPAPRACLRALGRLVRGADVVHAQDALYLTTAAALLLARRARVPSVLTQHVGFVPQGRRGLDLAQGAAIRTLGRVARLATAVAAYNDAVAAWARAAWGLRDVRLLPVGVSAYAASDEERRAVRAELGLEAEAFLAVFAGRDVPKKRLDVVLAAADPAYELVAVTDRRGDARAGVRLLPFTSPERFRRLLAAADAFVLPSQGEGVPLALQEALVSGLPCLVTREPGYERYLGEDDVLFVEPDPEAIRRALTRLAHDPERRRRLAERAAEVGRGRFGQERFVAAYERLYREVSAASAL